MRDHLAGAAQRVGLGTAAPAGDAGAPTQLGNTVATIKAADPVR